MGFEEVAGQKSTEYEQFDMEAVLTSHRNVSHLQLLLAVSSK